MAAQPAICTLDESAATTQANAAAQETVQRSQRIRLASAFQDLGHGTDEKAAYRRTKDWYRGGGADWTRSLT